MKINFKYSAPLDRFRADKDHEVIGYDKADKVLKQIKLGWKKEGKKILLSIAKITKIPWSIDEIPCYLVAGRASVSEPLIVAWKGNVKKTMDILTHELIHINLSQNKVSNGWIKLMDKYKDEPRLTRVHIVIHAIHKKVILKLYSKKHLVDEISGTKHPQYMRAWEMVERDGADEILNILLSQ